MKIMPYLVLVALAFTPVHGEEKKNDNDTSSNLTPTAERPPSMANPEKPGWLPQRHGK